MIRSVHRDWELLWFLVQPAVPGLAASFDLSARMPECESAHCPEPPPLTAAVPPAGQAEGNQA